MSEAQPLHPALRRMRLPVLIVGVVGLVACAIGLLFNRERFFLSWLYGFLFWLAIPLGSLALLSLQHLTGGQWALVIRRPLESGTRLLPLMALLFIPLLFGLRDLYVWAAPDHPDLHSPLKSFYLQPWFFILRAILYFAIWIAFAFFLNRWSLQEDRSPHPAASRRFQRLGAAALVGYGLTITFAAIDWVMSLDPHWYSTMIGVSFMVGQALAALAFMIALVALLATAEPLSRILNTGHFHDLGNLLLAFTLLWAYISFSQYLIIWMGNLEEETPYYLYRTAHGWKYVALLLIIFHFAVPFVLLLNRRTKRSRQVLASIALALLFMRLIDLFWMVIPMYHQGHNAGHHHPGPLPGLEIFHWLDLAAILGIGGLFLFVFLWQLQRFPLLPLHDYRLTEVTAHHG